MDAAACADGDLAGRGMTAPCCFLGHAAADAEDDSLQQEPESLIHFVCFLSYLVQRYYFFPTIVQKSLFLHFFHDLFGHLD